MFFLGSKSVFHNFTNVILSPKKHLKVFLVLKTLLRSITKHGLRGGFFKKKNTLKVLYLYNMLQKNISRITFPYPHENVYNRSVVTKKPFLLKTLLEVIVPNWPKTWNIGLK